MAIDGGAGSVSFLNEYRNELEITRNDEQIILARCGGSVRIIACIEDQDVIERILAHLRETEKGSLPHRNSRHPFRPAQWGDGASWQDYCLCWA